MTTLPISDLNNYDYVLSEVRFGKPVILTQNGQARYAVVDLEEWQMQIAKINLLEELQKGYQSLHSEGSISAADFVRELGNDFE